MITLLGPRTRSGPRFCDGLSRRSFLKAGVLGTGAAALSLADLYRLEAATGQSSHKSVINIFLAGGPPHQDLWDIKTDAPSEIRGEFKPISTNVPGIEIGEVFPQLSQWMHRVAVIRTLVGATGKHDAEQCLTGWPATSLASAGGRPSLGSAVSKLLGPVDPAVPPAVGLTEKTRHAPWGDVGRPGFLGPAFAPFQPDGPGLANMKLNSLSLERLRDRRELLEKLDRLRRDVDASGTMAAMDAFDARALDVLTSSKLVDALDLTKEDPRIVERYGDGRPFNFQYDGPPTVNQHLLLARRLVEVGVRCVTLSYGRWDSHTDNFNLVRDHGGKLDQCLSALVEDLDQRGLIDDVTVVVWGEFGRTPRINDKAGRDHWPRVAGALLIGGGMRTGQVIGATNRLGEVPQDRPVDFQEVFATLYHNLGIDVRHTHLKDHSGRPQFLVDIRQPIRELV